MIRFKVEMDDVIAFNQHSIATSPQHQANRKRSVVVIASVFMLLGGLQSFLHKSFAPLAVWAIVTALYCPWLYKKSGKVSAKKIQQLYSEGKDRLVLCEHEMEHL